MNNKTNAILLAVVLSNPIAAMADKSEYNAFNPTPKNEWREMSADRPDITESPITVDAGVWQIEGSFFDYVSVDDDNEEFHLLPVNIKLGLSHNMDLQLVLEPHIHLESNGEDTSGLGDTQIRLKINFWGNDEGNTALGLMPFIKLPTAADGLGNDEVEGGIILPYGTSINDQLGLGLMLELDAVYNAASDDYDFNTVVSAVLGYDAGNNIGFYLEGVIDAAEESENDLESKLGVGVTYSLNDSMTFDVGCNVGLTDGMDDYNIFSGITFRI